MFSIKPMAIRWPTAITMHGNKTVDDAAER